MKKLLKISLTLLFTVILLLGFAVPVNPPAGNWYQQFLPNIGSRTIQDFFFLDSLKGWAVTPFTVQNDTTYILKTTNGGDNWFIQFAGTGQFVGRNRIYFINANTGFTCGNTHFSGSTKITKTTDGGNSWTSINDPTTAVYEDMAVLNEDTIWLVASSSLSGGVYRTTNGGGVWEQQLFLGSQNPTNIYMYDKDTGFTAESSLYKTTNSGLNWLPVSGGGFSDMHFVNALTGWKASGSMQKTTNGGLNWVSQNLPTGGQIITSTIVRFSVLNKDTIWGIGGEILVNTQTRGIVYRTINGGQNWTFQTPDTAIYVPGPYSYIQFNDALKGWAYTLGFYGGIHTTSGGDPIWLTALTHISTEIPQDYELFQNYPNPFNPKTNIRYSVKSATGGQTSNVKLVIYDISGKEVITLVNQKQNAGTYEVDFSGSAYSSGLYFYTLIADGIKIDTKKMLLLK